MYFQDVILKLQEFWAKNGCIVYQPYDIEVGAGTFNPATFLRCLGPEPWNVAYVEPSRRPTDGIESTSLTPIIKPIPLTSPLSLKILFKVFCR